MSNQIKNLFPPEEKKKGNTCRTCKYKFKHEYGKMLYCAKRKQKGTAYGNLKIKAGNEACFMYEPTK